MRAIKYFFIGALIAGFSAPAVAQDVKTDVENIAKLIVANKNNPVAVKDQVKEFKKTYKKNAEALTGLGRAYLDIKDTVNAQALGMMAIKVNQHYGPGYVLLGDVEVAKDNGGAASGWFEQATMMDPKGVDGYRRYAQVNSRVSPASAVAKLEELRKIRPDYPVDIISAEIYDKAGNLSKAIEYYDKVDRDKMEDYQLASYATDCYLKKDYEKSLQIAQFGTNKFPKNAGLNRLVFFNQTELKNYGDALKAAEALFNSEKVKIGENDYLYYGHAYFGNQEYDKAIEMFQKTIEAKPDDAELVQGALKSISKAYSEKGDIENAAATYNKYLDSMKDKVTAYDYGQLASMYTDQAEKVEGDAKVALLMKADAVYATIAERFAEYADFSTYQRAHIGFALDPETKTGAAKPHYEKLIEIIKGHATKAKNDDARLIESYRYLGYYYLLQNDKATADGYWNKVLELDPENETAKQALGIQ